MKISHAIAVLSLSVLLSPAMAEEQPLPPCPGYGPGMMHGQGKTPDGKPCRPAYGPGDGRGPGMMYGPGYGQGYGPGYGPGMGSGHGPGMMYGPGYAPGPSTPPQKGKQGGDSDDDRPPMPYGPGYRR